MITEESPIKLSELLSEIKNTLADNLKSNYMVIGVISDYKGPNLPGHHYFKLIEKNGQQNIAEIKAIVFNGHSYLLKNYYTQTGIQFENGLEVLLKVKVEYHQIYGLSLIINAIDVNYTLGKIEDTKKSTLKRLKDERVISIIDGAVRCNNKNLPLPKVIQRIAIITSKGTEGENDFITRLKNNKRNFDFLFPYRELLYVTMQGKASAENMIEKLLFLKNKVKEIDAIVIVRGGGDESNFECFNDYELCKIIANFNIPIITGIGHEINKNIIDLIANVPTMVPAAAADIIIEHNKEFEDKIDSYIKIIHSSINTVKEERQQLESILQHLKMSTKHTISDEKKSLNEYANRIKNLNPDKVLARGYAILSINNELLSNPKKLKKSDKIKTILKSNIIESEVIKINKRNEKEFNL